MENLYADLEKKCYTDTTIILRDNNKNRSIDVHKCVLGCSLKYFDCIFNFGKEKNQNCIEINVDDVDATYDLILSFYGREIIYTNWRYTLNMFKCRNFFGLDNNQSLLYDLKVPPEGFNLLVEVIDLFDIDKKLLHVIKKNIPNDCILEDFLDSEAIQIILLMNN